MDPSAWCRYHRVLTALCLSRAVYQRSSAEVAAELNSSPIPHGLESVELCQRPSEEVHPYALAVCPSRRELWVALRGTTPLVAEVLADLQAFARPTEFEGRFHYGFDARAQAFPLATLLNLLDQYPDYALILTGHSLGGAVAHVVTLRLLLHVHSQTALHARVQCISFGAPLVCDEAASAYVSQRATLHACFHSYQNGDDIVVHLLALVGAARDQIDAQTLISTAVRWLTAVTGMWDAAFSAPVASTSMLSRGVAAGVRALLSLAGFEAAAAEAPKPVALTIDEVEAERGRACSTLVMTLEAACDLLLPTYVPHGVHFRNDTVYEAIPAAGNDDARIDTHHIVRSVAPDELRRRLSRLPLCIWEEDMESVPEETRWRLSASAMLRCIQQHSMDNYCRTFYTDILAQVSEVMETAPPRAFVTAATGLLLAGTLAENSPLRAFLPPLSGTWSHREAAPGVRMVAAPQTHEWSVHRSVLQEKGRAEVEELVVTLRTPVASFLCDLEVIGSSYLGARACRAESIGGEFQRVFVLRLPTARFFGRPPAPHDYRVRVRGHFGAVDLPLDPGAFTAGEGLTGRPAQVANLGLIDLYKLAFAFSQFAVPRGRPLLAPSRPTPLQARPPGSPEPPLQEEVWAALSWLEKQFSVKDAQQQACASKSFGAQLQTESSRLKLEQNRADTALSPREGALVPVVQPLASAPALSPVPPTFRTLVEISQQWHEAVDGAPCSSFATMLSAALPVLLLCGNQVIECLSRSTRSVATSKLKQLAKIVLLSGSIAVTGGLGIASGFVYAGGAAMVGGGASSQSHRFAALGEVHGVAVQLGQLDAARIERAEGAGVGTGSMRIGDLGHAVALHVREEEIDELRPAELGRVSASG